MDKVKAGIIGCGKFALGQSLPNCVAAENMELYHCSSIDEQGRKNAEAFNPKKISADYRDLLKDPEVDMVMISVPHEWHDFYLEEAIKAGKHVFCEKPMTMTMAEAYDVIKLVRRHGVKLCVDYNRRFSPAMIDMKRAYHAHKANPQGQPRVYLARAESHDVGGRTPDHVHHSDQRREPHLRRSPYRLEGRRRPDHRRGLPLAGPDVLDARRTARSHYGHRDRRG